MHHQVEKRASWPEMAFADLLFAATWTCSRQPLPWDYCLLARNSDALTIGPGQSSRNPGAIPFVDKDEHVAALYVDMKHIGKKQVGDELKKGSAELLILSSQTQRRLN
jgi:hypothetical protein